MLKFKRIVSSFLMMIMLMQTLPMSVFAVTEYESNETELLAGKTLSILGASISTYAGTSNGDAAETTNSTIRDNAKYYPSTTVSDVSLSDTWWMQAANDLGLQLLVNNSWSGSSLLYERNGTVGAYVDRCVQLHDDTGDNAGETPDIIAIQMGTNDFQYYKDTLGTADIDYDALIVENTNGTYTYSTPVTSLEAAAIVLHKISIRYPNAEVYYLNISQRIDGTDELIQSFNTELKQVVEYFNAHIVDIYNSAITMDDFNTYIGDGRVHPNKLGMDAYTEAFKCSLLANTAYAIDTHTVSFDLNNVSANYGDDKIVTDGQPFQVNLTPKAGETLNVSVVMGNEDITDTTYANGLISIQSVTDDVIISAESVHTPQNYRWEFDGTDLVSVGETENTLIRNAGTTTDGIFDTTRYALNNAVVLRHDLPWVVEWKCEGTFQNSGSSSGARIFSTTDANAEYGARYIFKSNKNGIIAMGEKSSSGSHNYGIALGDYNIDWTQLHTYRLENRVAQDGSNMVWLFVDDIEIGPMNNYYVGTTDQDITSNWLSGKDFFFPYMGTDTHGFTNAAIEYIQVSERTHNYAPLSKQISIRPGQLDSNSNGTILDSDIYGCVVNYELKKGHTLSISDKSYVFSVRKLMDDNYSTLLKQATTDSFTATEDMTVGMLIRKPDKSALIAQELSEVTIIDSRYNMIGVEGYEHAFTVEAETIDGGTATTRAAIFLPNSYSESGDPTRLIIMTNGLHGHLTDSVWNANTDDDVGVMKHYMDNGYTVIIVNNTANQTGSTPDLGNPQLISSYWKAYEYVQANFNVEELFSIHSRSQGTFAAIRLMREHPELVKCAVMCGAVLSLKSRFSNNPSFIAQRYGFDDTTGATWEADKVVGYDPYADVDGLEYDLPPTFWMLAEADATATHLSVIEKIKNHGNDVTQTIYTETDHSGVCRLNIEACRADSLAFLEKYQETTSEHRFCAWEVTSEATCTKAGEMRRYCADCDHSESVEIPALSTHVFESNETVCDICGTRFDVTHTEITLTPGQFDNATGNWVASDIYGCVIGYELKAGHTLSISNTDYVFAVRILENGSYTTMAREASSDSFTAAEDMTIAVRVRKPDKSTITEEELADIVLYDTYYVEHSHIYENGVCTPCGAKLTELFSGKTISILGDSISTFSGISNSTSYNSTIGSNAVYYSAGSLGVYRADTWWQQTIDVLGMELLVNNSWSGSTVFYPRQGENSVGYGDRCVNLHNDISGAEPDVIVVFLGTNDFSYYQSTLGTADIDYTALITDDGYATPTTTCEAYAIMLDKMINRYPDAEIYCMGMAARRSPDKEDGYADVGQPTAFNAELKTVMEHFDVTYVDLENCGIDADAEIFDTYMGDGRVHPNALGMDKITEALVSTMLGQTTKLHTVSYSLNGVSCSQDARIVLSGNSYAADLILLDCYTEMDVTITMDGVDITAECLSGNGISISEVSGDIAITAIGTINKDPESYTWEFDGSDLISTGDTENALAKQAGTITDGVFNSVRYSLATPVFLAHDAEWIVEWKCSGDWSGMLLTSTAQSGTTGMNFLFRTYTATGLLAIGEYSGQYNNYGIALADLELDVTVAHTYRLENRVIDDGANMVYLTIDGVEIGAMNNYYIAGTNNQNKTVDWVSGKDFVFGYIGSTSHPLKNMSLEYIRVEEDHAHAYSATITAPTCTEQGYTTHICGCGENYVDDYVEATGKHKYDDGVCVWCGKSKLGSEWLVPEFAQGDYTMVVLPDTQNLVEYWPETYYAQMQWIANNKDTLNIQAVLHMGDMVNTNNETQWTVCENGTNLINEVGIPWMPMMGNHDDSAWFNRYYDYATYGTNQSWFGGAYHSDKLDHTYWFVTVGEREYLVLSLGWAPSWEVLEWAQGIVEENDDKSVIITCHAYMNSDGTLLSAGDTHCVSSYYSGYPNGDDVWNALKDYGNVVLGIGGHIHCADLVTWVGQNGAGQDVTSILVDRQNDDISNHYAMVAVLTFHADSDTVDVNWVSTCYDALYLAKNQFSITVPDVCAHDYVSEIVAATCTEGGGTKYTCALCNRSYLVKTTEPLGHDFTEISVEPTCTDTGYTGNVCSVCGHVEKDLVEHNITAQFVWNEGYVISAVNGGTSADSNWVASDYVDISAFDSIEIVTGDTINAGTTLGLAFYDANKTYISGVLHTDKTGSEYGILIHNLEVPENTVYIRTTWYSVNHSSYPEGALNHTFYCKGYNTETQATGHDFEANICGTCGTVRVELTGQFTDWTTGGPVMFATGYGYGEEGYTSGSNPNLKYSGYISVDEFDMLELTVCARMGNGATGGYAFYTDKGAQHFVSEGASTRNGNGVSAEGTVIHTIEIPEGARYIRVTYWVDCTTYAVAVPFYCLGYTAHTHIYKATVTTPTCTEQGYTTYTCECGDSYVADCVEASGHTYENGICTICDAQHPNLENYEGKVISILGDSISTFAGYIPTADGFNLEHLARYPQDNLLTDVNETWWMQVINSLDAKLGINDSWRGATVSGAHAVTTGTTGENAAMHNLTRIQNLGANGTPDVILFYGGTNDLAHVAEVGSFDASTAPIEADFTTTKWDNLADGYVHTILRLKHYYPNAQIICLLPTYTASYYSIEKLVQANQVLASICEYYGVSYTDLCDCGITTADLPDGIHPDATGMDYITDAVLNVLLNNCDVEAGEHTVYNVSHLLEGVTASLGYYKGVSAGTTFAETLTGENMTVTIIMGGEDVTASVYTDGMVNISEVTGDLVITATGYVKPVHEDYLQQIPDSVCAGVNLWPLLKHDAEYYTVDGWGVHPSGTVYSVTIPVSAGERIWATSFGAAGTNGSTMNGIRLTWFNAEGVLKTVSPDVVYAEFAANGWLTAPEGAVAVNAVMWTEDEGNELYILNREHDYVGATCLICSATHPEAKNYAGKVFSILSASTSTFAGYIPVADGFNLEHRTRYPQDNLLTDVNETWWMQVMNVLDAKLGINDSWAGSTVSNFLDSNSGDLGPDACMASLTRIQNLGANGTPDVIFFFGAINDMGKGVTPGVFDPATAPTQVDLDAIKWDSFADAYVAAILRLQHFYPDAEIVVMLPYAMPSYATQAKLNTYVPIIKAICDHYGVKSVDLYDCGVTADLLPDNIHPNAEGMDYITNTVLDALLNEYDVEAGENVVYSITHNLTGAESSLGYYKGVSHGKPFTTTIYGEELTVTVSMGGVDITDSVYTDGVIDIACVTGNLVITASGKVKTVYEDYLQQLPDNLCAGTNLWTALEPVNIYYTTNGWGNTSSGTSWSVTFPVEAGDLIWATSFGSYPDNGSTANGIRITWFDEDGVLKTVSRDVVHEEFAANGYITVLEGAVALNVPMTNNLDTYAIHILNREHCYDAAVTTPTCTEQGYTTHTCSICQSNYVDSHVAALGHTEVVDAAVEATCTDPGLTEGKHCSVCHTVTVEQTVVPKLEHHFSYGLCEQCNYETVDVYISDSSVLIRSTELPEGVWLYVASYTEQGKLTDIAICQWQGTQQEIPLLLGENVSFVQIFFLDENQTPLRINRELTNQ